MLIALLMAFPIANRVISWQFFSYTNKVRIQIVVCGYTSVGTLTVNKALAYVM